MVATALRAEIKQDKQSKKILTRLFLSSQYASSEIPSVSIPSSESDTFKISSIHYADLELDFQERFLLMESADLLALLALFHRCKPKRVFEFGLMHGGSLLHFFLNSSAETRIDSLDLTTRHLSSYVRDIIANNPRINVHQGDSLQFDPLPFEKQMDFIFIDGGHDYLIVENDTHKAMRMLAPEGVIVWDDYVPDCTGVFKFINEFSSNHSNFFHIRESKLVFWKNGSKLF